MWRITIKGLLAHKIRYALTALAVLLGVAFIAGTFIFTDTINRTFDGLFSDIYKGTSAVVRADQAYSPDLSFTAQRAPIDDSLVTTIKAVPGVDEVSVVVGGYAQLVGSNGKAIGKPQAGAPTLGDAWNDTTTMNPYNLTAGSRAPRADDEVVIDKHSADVGHLKIGDQVTVLTKQAPAKYRIVGIVRWGTADSPLGASITIFTLPQAQRVLTSPGKIDQIDVAASPGISQTEMVARLKAALHNPHLDVVTGAKITQENQSQVRKALSFFDTFLLIFAGVALFVGSFLIFNTFSIVVAQRLRELALLRAVGASRAQVRAVVIGEAAAIGLVASAAGLGLGTVLAIGLRAMLKAVGMDIPSNGLVVTPRTIIVSLVLGTVITVVAAFGPARRAAKIPPVAALRDVAAGEEPVSRWRSLLGAALTISGVVLLSGAFVAPLQDRMRFVLFGSPALFFGATMVGPVVIPYLGGAVGRVVGWRGPTARIARNNAIRSPKRSASTAGSLMTGVAVVVMMSVMATSMKAAVEHVVDRSMRADFVINPGGLASNPGVGFTPALQESIAGLPQVTSATGVRAGAARVDGASSQLLAVDPARVKDLFDVDVKQGAIENMTPTSIAVSSYVAQQHHLGVGDVVHVVFPTTGAHDFTVAAVYGARALAGDYVLPIAAAAANFPSPLDMQIYIKLKPGISLGAGRSAVEGLLKAYPNGDLLDRAQYKQAQIGQVDQLLNLVYGLLGLALFIAIIGIANTLSLAMHERVHELGLLRAVGMTRGQVKGSVALESLIISLVGALQGVALGVFLGLAFVSALENEGLLRTLSVSPSTLIGVTLLAGIAGMFASAIPGRRAARIDVLRAINVD
jgi:putative ABC transport system permease protein